ncbi:hypothetical protein AVEN_110906-1, partial [Araneus ventricosus]
GGGRPVGNCQNPEAQRKWWMSIDDIIPVAATSKKAGNFSKAVLSKTNK